jgi:hypothetical protein
MKQLILITCLFIASNTFGQNNLDKSKAEVSVSKYMSVSNKNYKSVSFGEFFEQTDTKGIQEKLKTKEKIKYSLVHTYTIGSTKITDMYFHLDEKYKVLGKIPFKEMEQMMLKENSSKLDSIMSGLPGM